SKYRRKINWRIIGSALALEIVRAWMTTDYLSDIEKYTNRVDKVKKIAEKHLKKLDEIQE
ncbi:MAG TPA: Na+ dependent nucleoside transporter N-terminal domain-containing protein, partial [Trichococcus flocculiformis]|nr:Na+ dependent nucleoside transporter N-terminal domain-containing protein [Trichococcus flocculiformis]